MTEVSLFQKRTKLFWSWVHHVWLHLHSSQRKVKRLLWLWILDTKVFFLVT